MIFFRIKVSCRVKVRGEAQFKNLFSGQALVELSDAYGPIWHRLPGTGFLDARFSSNSMLFTLGGIVPQLVQASKAFVTRFRFR